MDYKFNLYHSQKFKTLEVYTHIYPNNKLEKEFKLVLQQYLINEYNLNELEDIKQKNNNNILKFKNNILIIESKTKLNHKNTINKLWFYKNKDFLLKEIINSFDNKLIKLNYKLYEYIIGDFKFKDIFILLYNKYEQL